MAGFLAPTVGLYAPKGMIVLFTCAAIACLYAYVMVKGQRPAIPRALRLSILALAVWSIASLGWTVSFKLTWSLARTLRFILLGGVLFIAIATKLSPKGRPFVAGGFCSGCRLGACRYRNGVQHIECAQHFKIWRRMEGRHARVWYQQRYNGLGDIAVADPDLPGTSKTVSARHSP